MQPDMIVSWDSHLKHGNIWRIDIELPMQDASDDKPDFLSVCVDVSRTHKKSSTVHCAGNVS